MKIIDVKIKDIKPYNNNPRHNSKAIKPVKESILKFGFKVPLVIDKNNTIVCGHTRFYASKEIGLESAPCIIADDLTEEQINAFRLVDNRVSEFADWDFDKLAEELSELVDYDLDPFGFDDLMAGYDFNLTKEAKEDDFDEEIPQDVNTKKGDLFKLGNHYLMCGDSTNKDDVKILTQGNMLDFTFTSPPYGASNSASIRKHVEKGVKNSLKSFYNKHDDNIDNWYELMTNFFTTSQEFTKSQFINVQMLADNKVKLITWLNDHLNNLVDIIIWKKECPPPQINDSVLNNAFEFIFCFDNDNSSRKIRFGNFKGNISNIIETKHKKNEYHKIHKAVFPVELPFKVLQINDKAKTIYDPFAGTGSTMIACEQLGRRCYSMEIDELYCDVIIKRWEDFTGNKAEKIN